MARARTEIAKRTDVSPKAGVSQYGHVTFADAKNKKYPIDTTAHIRAAWNYINKTANAGKYSSADAGAIKRKIVAAWKKIIDPKGPPSAQQEAAYRTACGVLQERSARLDDALVGDLAFGLLALRESDMGEKRAEVIDDLQGKARAAEETHDPTVIADLLQALNAFLAEELREIPANDDASQQPKEGAMRHDETMAPGDHAVAQRKARAIDDNFGRYASDAADPDGDGDTDAAGADTGGRPDTEARRARAEEDAYMKYAEEQEGKHEGRGYRCEACGAENLIPGMEAKRDESRKEETRKAEESAEEEEARKESAEEEDYEEAHKEEGRKEGKKREADPAVLLLKRENQRLRQQVKLAESERGRLVKLEAQQAYRDKLSRATKKCREAGGFVDPIKLMPFEESQWDFLLDVGQGDMREYNTPEAAMPAPSTPAPQARTARDVVTSAFNAAF